MAPDESFVEVGARRPDGPAAGAGRPVRLGEAVRAVCLNRAAVVGKTQQGHLAPDRGKVGRRRWGRRLAPGRDQKCESRRPECPSGGLAVISRVHGLGILAVPMRRRPAVLPFRPSERRTQAQGPVALLEEGLAGGEPGPVQRERVIGPHDQEVEQVEAHPDAGRGERSADRVEVVPGVPVQFEVLPA